MKFVHRTVQQQNKILLRQSFGADTAGGRLVFFQIWKNLNWNNHLNEEANNVKAKRENWNYAVEKIVGVFSWGNVARIPAFNVRMGHCKKKKKKKTKWSFHLRHASETIIAFCTWSSFGYLKMTPHMVTVRGRLKISSLIYLFCFHIFAWRKLHMGSAESLNPYYYISVKKIQYLH